MTQSRLQSDKPIDDEIPFGDARKLPRDDAPQDEDAIVTPAAAERDKREQDLDVEPSGRQQVDTDPERQAGHP